ncbi:hypothetical protein DCAR_0830975 [Daucus carota subsp. sativus]|uniref:Uncharacterized protein n=1 Tax=Daucus carota subsp. sativus TaxID=79200 RepID=A0A175YLX4_DAUCS|nr:hypothetical protein DCAR_0830975 [Daucus carota subsp. sativus]
MENDGNEPQSPGLGRKRRGRLTALDEFLLNRVSKMQQRGKHETLGSHTAWDDSLSNTRTALGTIDTNRSLNESNESSSTNTTPRLDVTKNPSFLTSESFTKALHRDKENVQIPDTHRGNPEPARKYRGPSIQTILDGKSKGSPSTASTASGSKKRGRGPGVNKMFMDMHKENDSVKEIPQGTKRRGRGLGAKTFAKQRLAAETQFTQNQGSLKTLGLGTPSSTITFQCTTGCGKPPCSHQYTSDTTNDSVGCARSNAISSVILEKLTSDECQRHFRPSPGASTSRVKNLFNEFEDAFDPSDFGEDIFMDGNVS